MSGNLPVMLIITSSDCSACRALHSTGDFNRDLDNNTPPMTSFLGSQWNAQLFWRLLTGSIEPDKNSQVKFRVMELEILRMNNRNGGFNNILGFTEFILNSNKDGIDINRNTYEKYQDDTELDGIMYLKDDTRRGSGERVQGSFTRLVSSKIPSSIFNLLYQYPSFMWFSPSQWSMAMRDPTYTPFALIYGLAMSAKDGKWAITDRDTPTDDRKTPVLMNSYISSNLKLLDPVMEQREISKKEKVLVEKSSTTCTPQNVKVIPLNNKKGYHTPKKVKQNNI